MFVLEIQVEKNGVPNLVVYKQEKAPQRIVLVTILANGDNYVSKNRSLDGETTGWRL